jgi:hypothetical protein
MPSTSNGLREFASRIEKGALPVGTQRQTALVQACQVPSVAQAAGLRAQPARLRHH